MQLRDVGTKVAWERKTQKEKVFVLGVTVLIVIVGGAVTAVCYHVRSQRYVLPCTRAGYSNSRVVSHVTAT